MCIKEQCCDEWTACVAVADCVCMKECVLDMGMGNGPCKNSCGIQGNQPGFSSLRACTDAMCVGDC
jgi:hypothetical protein